MNDQQQGDAWANAEQRYQSGQAVRGTVTRVAPFGVFVQIEPGIEGIVYAFELGNGPFALAGLAQGQTMQLYVKSIDTSKKRLELSLSNTPLPLPEDERTLPPALRRKAQPEMPSWPLPSPLTEVPANPANVLPANGPCCPTCQRQIQTSWKFCVYCGSSLRRRCPACASLQPDLPDARYCYECGKPV